MKTSELLPFLYGKRDQIQTEIDRLEENCMRKFRIKANQDEHEKLEDIVFYIKKGYYIYQLVQFEEDIIVELVKWED